MKKTRIIINCEDKDYYIFTGDPILLNISGLDLTEKEISELVGVGLIHIK